MTRDDCTQLWILQVRVFKLTNGEAEDVLGGRQGKAEPPGVMTDNLNTQQIKKKQQQIIKTGGKRALKKGPWTQLLHVQTTMWGL